MRDPCLSKVKKVTFFVVKEDLRIFLSRSSLGIRE